MSDLSTGGMPWRNGGILVAGLVAGGGTAYFLESNIPPAVVMAIAFLVIVVDRNR